MALRGGGILGGHDVDGFVDYRRSFKVSFCIILSIYL